MILKRFYEDSLAQASFLIGCARTREALVIDPTRDAERYLREARAARLEITGVTETHIHADFASGSRELAARAGARLYLSGEGGPDWAYDFAGEPNVTTVHDGDAIRAGAVRLDVRHTPGHTPEHVSFVLTDEAATDQPQAVFTGDFVFAGDVGRPDLLERAARVAGTMEQSARTLFRSLQAFKTLPGHLMLWPGHGAGSACGKSLGGVPVTTLAYEMLSNWGLRATDEDAFVTEVLAGQPDPPTYFREMKRINKAGPAALDGFRVPPRLDPESALAAIEGGALFVDLRTAAEFARAFIPGVLNIPAGGPFTTWAGWLLPYDRPVYLLSGNEADVAAGARELALIGIDDVRGWAMTATAINGWAHRHGAPETLPRLGFSDAVERMRRGEMALLDVRNRAEYLAGHVPGATNIPLGHLMAHASELRQTLPVGVHCAGGDRSPIAASVLRRLGFVALADVAGGFAEYRASGLPIETGEPAEVPAR